MMRSSLGSRTACWSILAFSVLIAAGFAEENMPSVVLPKLDVQAARENRTGWRYSRVGGWDVFSQVSDTRARSLLRHLQEFDFTLHIIQPRWVEGPAAALTVVLVDEARYRSFVSPAAANESLEFSTWIHRAGRSAIIVNTEADFGTVDSAVAVDTDEGLTGDAAVNPNTVDPYRQLDRQYLRHLLAARGAQLPAWLEEGLAQALADVEYSGSWVSYGKVDTEKNMPPGYQPLPPVIADFLAPNSTVSGLNFKQVFALRPLMPLETFFSARRPDGSAPSSDSAWAKQAYAFVHFCLFGSGLRYQEAIAKLATRLSSAPMSEELFKECFGIGYAKMEKGLSGYILHTRHKYQRYPLKPDQRLKPEQIDFREATKAEVDRLTQFEWSDAKK